MRFLSLSFFAFVFLAGCAIVNGDEAAQEIEELAPIDPRFGCNLRPHNLLLTRKKIIGVSTLPSFSGVGTDVIFAFEDGCAIRYDVNDLHQRKKNFQKFLLAPAYGDDESCNTNSLESVEFDCMSVTMCPGILPREPLRDVADIAGIDGNALRNRNRPGKTFFAYHKKGDSFPSASYAVRGPASRLFCQVFPTTPHPKTLLHCPGFAQPSSSAFSFFDNHHGDLYFMVDYDNNDILVQVGTTLSDCDNPLVRRHFHDKITSFATCCNTPIVFIGFENGNIGIYAFKTIGTGCNGKFVCISVIPPPCGCDCIPPVPVGIQLCCDFDGFLEDVRRAIATEGQEAVRALEASGWKFKTQITVLYKNHNKCCKAGKETLLKSIDLEFAAFIVPFKGIEYTIIDKRVHPGISNNVIDYRVCCETNELYVFVIVKDCDGRLRLIKYSLRTGRFVSMVRLPCDVKIRSWTVVGSTCNNRLLGCNDCCALFVFELPPPCDDCERCPPKTGVVAYCCKENPRQIL